MITKILRLPTDEISSLLHFGSFLDGAQ